MNFKEANESAKNNLEGYNQAIKFWRLGNEDKI
jgi:hypothetical protein